MLGEWFQPKTVVWYHGNNIVLGGRGGGGEKDASIIFARDCLYIYAIFIFSNPTRFYVMSSRISSNLTRYDVKAGTIRKNEYLIDIFI
jgi:hypothetical protein